MISTQVFALIDRDRRVLRSTDGFRTLSLDVEAACEGSPDIERVLCGSAQTATMVIGQTELEISAVTDGTGAPHALLRLPTGAVSDPGTVAGPDDWVAGVRALVQERPVLAWLKDTAGRHVYVNRRYLETLQVAEETVLGRTDNELAPGESVDGPRRSLAADGIEEPQELEYTVPAFAQRPAFAAVRFLVRGPDGEVHGICGLAAPLEQAPVVRQEVERISASRSPTAQPATQDELLREWGVALSNGTQTAPDEHPGHETDLDPAPECGALPPPPDDVGPPWESAGWPDEPAGPPPAREQAPDLVERWEDCVQHLQSEARHWQDEVAQSRSVVQEAQAQLGRAVAERDAAQQEHDRLRGELDELERALTMERTRNEELVRTIEQLRFQVSEVGRTIDHALPGEAVTSVEAENGSGDFSSGPSEWSG